jgi:hypothetical protein
VPDALWQSVVAALPLPRRAQRRRATAGCALWPRTSSPKRSSPPPAGSNCRRDLRLDCRAGLPADPQLGLDYYRGWVGVIVYADEFIIPRSVEDEFGVVHEYQELASGEAWDGGPAADFLARRTDGRQRLQRRHPRVRAQARHAQWRSRTASRRCRRKSTSDWQQVLLASYDDFCQQVDEAEAGGEETLVRPLRRRESRRVLRRHERSVFRDPGRAAGRISGALRPTWPGSTDRIRRDACWRRTLDSSWCSRRRPSRSRKRRLTVHASNAGTRCGTRRAQDGPRAAGEWRRRDRCATPGCRRSARPPRAGDAGSGCDSRPE